jgi:hypothetical protein
MKTAILMFIVGYRMKEVEKAPLNILMMVFMMENGKMALEMEKAR